MTFQRIVRPIARSELAESSAWYESRKDGLGVELVMAVEAVFGEITTQPNRFPIAVGDIREAPVTGFPFCVYYRVRGDRVIVLAVFHTARDPSIWQSRS